MHVFIATCTPVTSPPVAAVRGVCVRLRVCVCVFVCVCVVASYTSEPFFSAVCAQLSTPLWPLCVAAVSCRRW